MNAKTNEYRVDIASEWHNVLKTPENLHLLSTQLSVLCAMAEADAIAERDEMRAKLLDELSDSELQRLQAAAERDAARIAAQEWRTAATMRRAEADELRNTLAQLREQLTDREHDLAHEYKRANDAEAERGEMSATVVKLSEELGSALRERDALREQVAELREDLRECRDERDAATMF